MLKIWAEAGRKGQLESGRQKSMHTIPQSMHSFLASVEVRILLSSCTQLPLRTERVKKEGKRPYGVQKYLMSSGAEKRPHW